MVQYKNLILSFLLCFSFFCSDKKESNSPKIMARVGDSSISINKIEKVYGKHPIDSLLVYSYLSGWIEDELLFRGGVSLVFRMTITFYKKRQYITKNWSGMLFLISTRKKRV